MSTLVPEHKGTTIWDAQKNWEKEQSTDTYDNMDEPWQQAK